MARERRIDWAWTLEKMNQAILLCRGVDAEEGTRWYLYGLPGNVYFTIEAPAGRPGVPYVVPCDGQAAAVLYDDARFRDAPTLDVDRAVRALRAAIFGRLPRREH